MRILSQALRGFLSGFYFSLMIYRQAIKTPFASALRALQQHGRYIPAKAGGGGDDGG